MSAELVKEPCRHDAIRGFATVEPSPDLDSVGELRALYVDPPHWGAGAGHLLIAEACERLRRGGFELAVLWLLAGNEQAARFYRSCGWTPDGARRREDPWGVDVEVQRWRRTLESR